MKKRKSYAQLQKESAKKYYNLWLFFAVEHGLILTEGELDDIIYEVTEHEKKMKKNYEKRNLINSHDCKKPFICSCMVEDLAEKISDRVMQVVKKHFEKDNK